MIKIGIIEDDKLLNEALCITLEKEGYEPIRGFSIKDGIEVIAASPDLLLLDINLPDGLGFQVAEKARGIPIVFLTARDDETDMIRAFDHGCEDYIVKPFSEEILKRRIQVALRRTQIGHNVLRYKNLYIDYDKKQVFIDNEPVSLTRKEYQLLEYLSKHPGQTMSKGIILQDVWDIDGLFVVDNTVSVTINRLKKKIERDTENPYIKNIFGMGYVFGE